MERPTCKTCVFWGKYDENQGICRRLPPNSMMYLWPRADTPSETTTWPEVWEGDWCGEHPQFPRYLASLDEGRHTPETMP